MLVPGADSQSCSKSLLRSFADLPVVYVAWRYGDEWQMLYGVPEGYAQPASMTDSGDFWELRQGQSTKSMLVSDADSLRRPLDGYLSCHDSFDEPWHRADQTSNSSAFPRCGW